MSESQVSTINMESKFDIESFNNPIENTALLDFDLRKNLDHCTDECKQKISTINTIA